jgi:hypothetical protein
MKHMGVDDAREAMILRAQQLVEEAQIEAPPVDLRRLASFQGVKRIDPVEMAPAGLLLVEGESYVIRVNAKHGEGRRRFTACHEIGHTFLHECVAQRAPERDAATGEFSRRSEAEYLCDVAAAELLMPTSLFAPRLRDTPCSLRAVRELAGAFSASREATAIRLVQLGDVPCAVAIWEVLGEAETDPIVRLRYAVCARHFGHTLARHLPAEEHGTVRRCVRFNRGAYGEESLDVGHVRVWFRAMATPIRFDGPTGHPRGVLSILFGPGVLPSDSTSLRWITHELAY